MNKWTWIILGVIAAAAYWVRRGKGPAALEIGQVKSETFTGASALETIQKALGLAVANEDPVLKEARSKLASDGARVKAVFEAGPGVRYFELTNGWRLPDWLVTDYFKIPAQVVP